MRSAARYQPVQENPDTTSPQVLYPSADVGTEAFEPGTSPFIRRPAQESGLATDTSQEVFRSPVEGQQVTNPARGPIPRPRIGDPEYRLQLLQQWECVVRSVTPTEFVAVLYDLTDRSKPEEEATFPLDEVPDSDRSFVAPGAVFYWSIGYRTGSTGQKDRISQIRFRRLPTWTRSERNEAAREVLAFEELLGKK